MRLTAHNVFGRRACGDLLNGPLEPAKVDRFGEMGGEPRSDALLDVVSRAKARQGDSWDRSNATDGVHELRGRRRQATRYR